MAVVDHDGEGAARPGRPGPWRHRRHRVGGGAAAEGAGCPGDRDLRHRHMEPVRGLGADRVVDYTAGDFTRDAQAYDVVFDAVGKSSFLRCRRPLKPRGSYLWSDLGPMWQNMFFSLITPLFGRRKSRSEERRVGE